MEQNKILLHACCGICSGYPILKLKEMGYSPVVYFCNPNLDTKEEFDRRLDAQRAICKCFEVELIVEGYEPQEYLDYVKGYENEPEKGKRCDKCIELRLKKTYDKYKIVRETAFPYTESAKDDYHRYNIWKSTMPRRNNMPKYGDGMIFSIKNKDGMDGSLVHICGTTNRKGNVVSVGKLKFPLDGYDKPGISNLARIYLKKIFNMFMETPSNKRTYYIDEQFDKILKEIDEENNVPVFVVTDEIQNSINTLWEKYKEK